MAEQISAITLGLSNLNLPPRLIATGDVAAHLDVLHAIEGVPKDGTGQDHHHELYDALYEITPTRRLVLAAHAGSFTYAHRKKMIRQEQFATRLHQPWPEGPIRGTRHARTLGDAAFNLMAYGVMPETHRAFRMMRYLNARLGGVPWTVYVNQFCRSGELLDLSGNGAEQATQPSPEALMAIGAQRNYRRFHNSLMERGIYGGVVGDNHHLVRAALHDPDFQLPWREILDAIDAEKTPVNAVHFSAGREDTRHEPDRIRSRQELAAIFAGPDAISKTIMGEVHSRLYQTWNSQADLASKLPVIIEVPFKGLRAYHKDRPISLSDFGHMYRDIGQSVREFFARQAKALTQSGAPSR